MSTEAVRAEFERWFSEDGAWPAAIEKDRSGEYKLAAAVSSWHTWEAAMQHSARAALAQPSDDGMCPNCVTPWKCNGPHIAPAPQRTDEPVAQVVTIAQGRNAGKQVQMLRDLPNGTKLYTTAPAAPAYVPLSEPDIDKVFHDCFSGFVTIADQRKAARAIEALVVARTRGEK
jgi:hypothetical protein